MFKNLLVFAYIISFPFFANAQSAIQIISSNHEPIYITLENPNDYFEESGDNITIANLEPNNYILSFARSLDLTAPRKVINISIPNGQKWIFNVGYDLRIDKSVVIIPTKVFRNTPLPPRVNPMINLHAMAKEDFGRLLASVQGQTFDDSKIALITPAAKYAAFTSEQIAQLLSSFQFDEAKLKYAKLLFQNAIDKENYNKVCEAFTFSSYCNQLMNFVAKQQ